MNAPQGTVYRAIAADGTVLYVGMTTRFGGRMKEHAKRSAWWPLHDRIEQDEPLPIDDAYRSEADQITRLRPGFNRLGGIVERFGPDQTVEEQAREWKARYEAGETIEEIALAVHTRSDTVRKHLHALGTEMRRPGQRVGIQHQHRANAPHRDAASDATVRVAFAGARAVHRRRGSKRTA